MTMTADTRRHIVILGSGTCVPSVKRSPCSLAVRDGRTLLLLDAGPGIMKQLVRAGLSIFDLDAVLLSHFHPDHVSDLTGLLFSMKYDHTGSRDACLRLIGGTGLKAFYRNLNTAFGQSLSMPESSLSLNEIDLAAGSDLEVGGIRITAAATRHRTESLAYRLVFADGYSLVYSGDTDYAENLAVLARDADLLVCESSFPDRMKVSGHLTPGLAGEIASAAGVETLVLTHLNPECDQADIRQECRKKFAGRVVIAQDLMVL